MPFKTSIRRFSAPIRGTPRRCRFRLRSFFSDSVSSVDSYVFGNVVYDKILKDGKKVMRMLPSPQDVLYALGNNASAILLQD